MDYLSSFRSWLKQKNYSDSTIRNYLVDLSKYFQYLTHLPLEDSANIFSQKTLTLYVSYLSDKSNSSRYLASLNQFCQFALDQKLVSANPLKKIGRQPPSPDLSQLTQLYEQYLTKHGGNLSTIRNYINDITQYISWLENTKVEPQ